MYYYDPSSFEDIQVSSGAQDITVPSGGVFINMVTKSGTNRFGSQTLFTYQAEGTQSDNIDEELKNSGLRPNAAAVGQDHELQRQCRRPADQEPCVLLRGPQRSARRMSTSWASPRHGAYFSRQ